MNSALRTVVSSLVDWKTPLRPIARWMCSCFLPGGQQASAPSWKEADACCPPGGNGVWSAGRFDAGRRQQSRHEICAAVQHQPAGLIVEVNAVIDRADPSPNGVLDAVGGLGMGHDPDPGGGGLGDQNLQLYGRVVGVGGLVPERSDTA